MKHIVVGVIGHVDHGKTALVGALTGQDTDRLREEKARGISIALGFAHFSGEDGTLVLANPTADYFRGFALRHARRGDAALQTVPVEDFGAAELADVRVVPVGRLVGRFIEACVAGGSPAPGFAEGYRVQCLIDAARRAHGGGHWIDVAPPTATGGEGRT